MKILVTGGAGYVGSAAARLLVASDHTVVALDNLSEGHRSAAPRGTLVEGDLSDRALLARLLREHDVEAVLHFAGSTYVGVSMRDPESYWRNNVAHTLGLLEGMREAGVGMSASVHIDRARTNKTPARQLLTERSMMARSSTGRVVDMMPLLIPQHRSFVAQRVNPCLFQPVGVDRFVGAEQVGLLHRSGSFPGRLTRRRWRCR